MIAVTLFRPWDEPVAAGAKPIENRPNPPPRKLLGEYVAIHAGLKYDYDGAEAIKARGFELAAHDPARIGAIVGVARIAGWLDKRPGKGTVDPDGNRIEGLVTCAEDRFLIRVCGIDTDPWFFGPVGILLVDAVAIRPVKCRGMQGWWTVPANEERTVRERWEAARAA